MSFDLAEVKEEGKPILYDGERTVKNGDVCSVDYTYVERRVPRHLEDEAHNLIDAFLKEKGYTDE